MAKPSAIYGLMAEFDEPTTLVAATQHAHREGYRCMDAYSPFPIEELHEALGAHHTRLPLIVLIGGLCGCIGGYGVQDWAAALAHPVKLRGQALYRLAAVLSVPIQCPRLAGGAVRGPR